MYLSLLTQRSGRIVSDNNKLLRHIQSTHRCPHSNDQLKLGSTRVDICTGLLNVIPAEGLRLEPYSRLMEICHMKCGYDAVSTLSIGEINQTTKCDKCGRAGYDQRLLACGRGGTFLSAYLNSNLLTNCCLPSSPKPDG